MSRWSSSLLRTRLIECEETDRHKLRRRRSVSKGGNSQEGTFESLSGETQLVGIDYPRQPEEPPNACWALKLSEAYWSESYEMLAGIYQSYQMFAGQKGEQIVAGLYELKIV